MSMRPQLFTRGLSGPVAGGEAASAAASPAEQQRDDAKRNLFKTMRALPTQHYWTVYFDRQTKEHRPEADEYKAELEQLGSQIESVQDFWRYNNNTPVENIKMRESIYLFKAGFRPVWEDRRNVRGGSWTFRVPKVAGPDVWTRIQLLAIGEKLQTALDVGDQLCGVGLSVRFNSHLITVWHRDSSKQKSIDGMLACVLEELPPDLRPKPDNFFYKRHCDHVGFKAPVDDDTTSNGGSSRKLSPTDHPQHQHQQPQLRVDPPSAH